jgi:hypothetical protein
MSAIKAVVIQQLSYRRIVFTLRSLFAVARMVLIVICAQPAGAQQVFEGRGPLVNAADLLERIYATPVTYESPQPLWEGAVDFYRTRNMPDGTRGAWPRQHSLIMPDGVNPEAVPVLTLAIVQKVVDAYNQQNPDQPRFRVLESRLGFHIVPSQVHDVSGKLVPATNPLDTVISVPRASRTAFEHLNAILDAVKAASGIPLIYPDRHFNNYYAANSYIVRNLPPTDAERPYMLFEWGVSDVSARDALISLMDGSSSTMSWRLSCGGMGWQNKTCGFGISALIIGESRTTVFLDRCTNCAPIPVPEVDVRTLPGWTPLK